MIKCQVCGKTALKSKPYYNLSIYLLKRKLPYFLPISFLSFFFPNNTYVNKLLTNKKYFNKHKVRCKNCNLGFVYPPFNDAELEEYYNQQYWDFRDQNEGSHIVSTDQNKDPKFTNAQLSLHQKRIDFINSYVKDYKSVLDFGAGDCSAASIFKNRGKSVTVYDFSSKSYDVSKQLGVKHTKDLSQLRNIDLVYSSHSLEHVSDIKIFFEKILNKYMSTKYLFFETPNIKTDFVFNHLIHTPHTFMFNEVSFRAISQKFNLQILGIQHGGSHWSYFKNDNRNCTPDIRVLFKNKNLKN